MVLFYTYSLLDEHCQIYSVQVFTWRQLHLLAVAVLFFARN